MLLIYFQNIVFKESNIKTTSGLGVVFVQRDILKESFLFQFEKYLDWITNRKPGLDYVGTPSITDV